MQRKAKQRKAKQRKAKQSNVVCRSVCRCPILKPQQLAGFGWRARFAPSAPPRLASLSFSSPLLSSLIFACVGYEQNKAMQRKAKQRKEKQRKAKQSNVVCRSVCKCPILKPQQLAGFGWRSSLLLSSHFLSLCVQDRSRAKQCNEKLSNEKQSK